MKTIKSNLSIFFTILVLSFALASCDKKDQKDDNQSKGATASINIETTKETINFSGNSMASAWVKEDGINILSLIFTDKENKAILSISACNADGAGNYELAKSTDCNANPLTLSLNNFANPDKDNYQTGGINIDNELKYEGSGTLKVTELTEKMAKGSFTATAYNMFGNKVTIEGNFNCNIIRITE